jgi:hypothetical protein
MSVSVSSEQIRNPLPFYAFTLYSGYSVNNLSL